MSEEIESEYKYVGDSLAEASAFVDQHAGRGVSCPCCGRYNKIYRRTINGMSAGLLRELAAMYRDMPPDARWFHTTRDVKKFDYLHGGDYSKLEFWGLLEPKGLQPGDRGYWRITELGLDFVAGKISLWSRALILNNRFLGFSGRLQTFAEMEKAPFDKAELLAA